MDSSSARKLEMKTRKKLGAFVVLFRVVIVFCLCGVRGVRALSLCTKISMELGLPEYDTLCDLDFCTCRDPFGRVRCVCPGEDPNEEIVLKSKGTCSISSDTTSLSLENCMKVTVMKGGLEDVRSLRNMEFVNVTEVSIQGRLFASEGPGRIVHFKNSAIPDIPSFAFSGNLDSVIFEGCNIGTIRAFAFSNIKGADRIMFRETNVTDVEAQSLKKFTMNKFLIIDSRFHVVPSRFVVDVRVESVFKIEASHIDVVRTLGFQIYGPKKLIVINSSINRLQEEAFKIVTTGDVVIENNVVNTIDNEALRGLSVDKYVVLQNGKQKFKFNNQTVRNLEDKSLYVNRTVFDVQTEKLVVDEACTCDGLVLWKNIMTKGKKTVDPIEVELEPILCRMEQDTQGEGDLAYVRGRQFYNDHCTKLTASIYFFVLIIAATAVTVLLVITVIVCIIRRRRTKWKYIPSAARDAGQKNHQSKNDIDKKKKARKKPPIHKSDPTKAIIVPDGRTYKETEFHIIVEKAEPLNDDCVPCTVVRDRSQSQINSPNRA